MATGQILFGGAGRPLYGKNGTVLYAAAISMSVSIVISWSGGNDLDVCALYDCITGSIGYGHGSSINEDGFTANWTSGDNTSGGPETISLSYSGNRSSLSDVHFDIHANWYSVGTDSEGNELSGGGTATISCTDSAGNARTATLSPGTSKGRAANTGDPGVRINFNANGTLKSITSA